MIGTEAMVAIFNQIMAVNSQINAETANWRRLARSVLNSQIDGEPPHGATRQVSTTRFVNAHVYVEDWRELARSVVAIAGDGVATEEFKRNAGLA